MKYALIGAGNCGLLWKNAITAAGDSLIAVCDTDVKRARSLANGEADVFSDANELAAAGVRCDYAVVSTPVRTHPEICAKLVQAGYDVVSEKPFSYDLDHYKAAKKLACEKGRKLVCVYHAAHGREIDCFLEQRARLEDRLGKLVEFNCKFFDPYCGNQRGVSAVDGLYGSYLDSAVNALSVLARIIDLNTVSATEDVSRFMSPDNLSSVTHYHGSVSGTLETDWTCGQNLKVTTLFYEKGKVVLHHSDQTVIVCGDGCEEITDCNPQNTPRLLNQYVAILESLRISSIRDASAEILPLLLKGKTK